jgi:hypothetical protein
MNTERCLNGLPIIFAEQSGSYYFYFWYPTQGQRLLDT